MEKVNSFLTKIISDNLKELNDIVIDTLLTDLISHTLRIKNEQPDLSTQEIKEKVIFFMRSFEGLD